MELKAVDEYDEYLISTYEFRNHHGERFTQPIIEGKDKLSKKGGVYTFKLAHNDAEVVVKGPLFVVTKTQNLIRKRRKQKDECLLCEQKALGATGLCKQHGGTTSAA